MKCFVKELYFSFDKATYLVSIKTISVVWKHNFRFLKENFVSRNKIYVSRNKISFQETEFCFVKHKFCFRLKLLIHVVATNLVDLYSVFMTCHL